MKKTTDARKPVNKNSFHLTYAWFGEASRIENTTWHYFWYELIITSVAIEKPVTRVRVAEKMLLCSKCSVLTQRSYLDNLIPNCRENRKRFNGFDRIIISHYIY